ncbi:hypothetical protein KA478_02490 [Patescibacteria group bacterium]|nr:hypothetical protein [Patescibacteria group bacterium]
MREHQEVKIQIEKNMKKYLEPLYKRESEINAKSADIYRILTDEIANPHSFIRQNTQHYFNIKNKKYMSFLKLGKQLKAGNHDHEIDEDIAESTRRAYQDIVSGKDDIEKKISMAITPLYFQNILI